MKGVRGLLKVRKDINKNWMLFFYIPLNPFPNPALELTTRRSPKAEEPPPP
jgi:hypothetical protein